MHGRVLELPFSTQLKELFVLAWQLKYNVLRARQNTYVLGGSSSRFAGKS